MILSLGEGWSLHQHLVSAQIGSEEDQTYRLFIFNLFNYFCFYFFVFT